MKFNVRDLIHILDQFQRMEFEGDHIRVEFGSNRVLENLCKSAKPGELPPFQAITFVDFTRSHTGEWEVDLSPLKDKRD